MTPENARKVLAVLRKYGGVVLAEDGVKVYVDGKLVYLRDELSKESNERESMGRIGD